MKVRCIEADEFGYLVEGEIYTVGTESASFYYLIEVVGAGGWFKERFEIIEEKSTKPTDFFKGKTILRVNSRSVNVMKFYFTDGTGVELWAECGSRDYDIPHHQVKKFTYTLRKCGRIGKVTYLP